MPYFERFVSWRYLFARHRRALVSIITFISIGGVAVGVGALIIVLGVIEGMDKDIFGKFVEIYPHIKVMAADKSGLREVEPLLAKLREHREVELVVPVIQKQVLFVRDIGDQSEKSPGQLVGVDELGDAQPYPIRNRDGSNIKLGDRELLLGAPLGFHLGARSSGETYPVLVRTGNLARTPNGWAPRSRNLTAIGHFTTGIFDFDSVTGFVSLATAREVFGMSDTFDYIHVKLRNPLSSVRSVKQALEKELGPAYAIKTWEEENGAFFQALKLEKLGLFVIMLLVVIVASFNIIGTLILTVIEKKREIGLLKAIGASDGMIRRTFLTAGSIIGVLGTSVGFVLGLGGCYVVKNLRLDFAASPYAIDRLPVVIRPLNIALIIFCALTISLLAALFPAAQAGRLDPIEALRDD